jgi:hypothetical protein
MSSNLLRFNLILLLSLTIECTKSHQSIGGETNWLRRCDDDSDCNGTPCVCNVCTLSCKNDAECDDAPVPSVCFDKSTLAYNALCDECDKEDTPGLCLPECGPDDACSTSTNCYAGACVPDRGEAGTVVEGDGGGDAGEGAGDDSGTEIGGDGGTGRPNELLAAGKYPGPCTVEGLIDGTVEERCSYTYDDKGNMLVAEHDYDGTVDYRATATHDEYGNLLTFESDEDADGTVEFRLSYIYTYDEYGNMLTWELDTTLDNGGMPSSCLKFYYYYEPETVNAEPREGFNIYLPNSIPSIPYHLSDVSCTYTYDDDGNILTREFSTPERGRYNLDTYTYDPNGNLLTKESDSDFDGTVDFRTTYTHDGKGNLLTEEYDIGGDGTVDSRTTYTYDANGNLLTEDRGHHAPVAGDTYITYTYNTDGNMLTQDIGSGTDGATRSRTTYTYDADRNTLTYELDISIDGVVDTDAFYTYDCWE